MKYHKIFRVHILKILNQNNTIYSQELFHLLSNMILDILIRLLKRLKNIKRIKIEILKPHGFNSKRITLIKHLG